jgi:hypothetical protein
MSRWSMAWSRYGKIWIVLLGENAPTASDWNGFIQEVSTVEDPQKIAFFMYSEGASPSAAQRRQWEVALRGSTPPVALVTSSDAARAYGVALTWFNPAVSMFKPQDLASALRYLEVPLAERGGLIAEIAECGRNLGLRMAAESLPPSPARIDPPEPPNKH